MKPDNWRVFAAGFAALAPVGDGRLAAHFMGWDMATPEQTRDSSDPRQATRGGPAGTARCRVLVVEDSDDTRRIFAMVLSRWGHAVTAVATVGAAIEAVGSEAFDLLLSDIKLPDGTGLDVIRHVRDHQPNVVGVAVSGLAYEEDVRRSLDAGFAAHLIKPFDMRRLKDAIDAVLAPP